MNLHVCRNIRTEIRNGCTGSRHGYAESGKGCSESGNGHSERHGCAEKRAEPAGSLTIEAAFILPLFILFFSAVMGFIGLVYVQTGIQNAIEETARELGKKAYLLSAAESTLDNTQDNTQSKTGNADKASNLLSENPEDASLLSVGINPSSIKTKLLLNESLRKTVANSRIKGGVTGLYTFNSTFDEDTGILDIIVHYDYSFPWLPAGIGTIRFVQRCRSHVWTGSELEKTEEEVVSGTTVYITPHGTVYHMSTECSYLDLSISAVDYSEVGEKRNASGCIYGRCPVCGKRTTSGTVYITDYGTTWHGSLTCSGLKRTVQAIDISEVGSRRPCPKCGNTGS